MGKGQLAIFGMFALPVLAPALAGCACCRGPYCVLAIKAVELLRAKGYKAVRFDDGVPDWRAHGFEVAVGEESA